MEPDSLTDTHIVRSHAVWERSTSLVSQLAVGSLSRAAQDTISSHHDLQILNFAFYSVVGSLVVPNSPTPPASPYVDSSIKTLAKVPIGPDLSHEQRAIAKGMFLSGAKGFNDDVASPMSSLGSYAGSLTGAREDSSPGMMGKLAAWREQDGKKLSPMTSSSVCEVSEDLFYLWSSASSQGV